MFRSVRSLLFLVATVSTLSAQTSTGPDIQATLSRAEALYYEAQFNEAIQLLTPLDTALQKLQDYSRETIRVKLQLGLSYIGLNQVADAKVRFAELCSLDPSYELDPQFVAPKVISLFNEARDETNKTRCSNICLEGDRLRNAGDLPGIVTLLRSAPKGCTCLEQTAQSASESAFKAGLEQYKNGDRQLALTYFNTARNLNPKHELSGQYIDLVENRIKLELDQLVLDWRKRFDAREFSEATEVYRRLASSNPAEKSAPALEQVRGQYRQEISRIIQTWKQQCSTKSDSPNTAIQLATLILPDMSIARDLLDDIKPCPAALSTLPAAAQAALQPAPQPQSAPPSPSQSEPCVPMPPQLAMVRLRTRVNPDIPHSVRPSSVMHFVVKARIDTQGDVTVSAVESPNPFLSGRIKAAVEQWKFAPAIVEAHLRCVDTDLQIALSP